MEANSEGCHDISKSVHFLEFNDISEVELPKFNRGGKMAVLGARNRRDSYVYE
jgi:hypothetical protein